MSNPAGVAGFVHDDADSDSDVDFPDDFEEEAKPAPAAAAVESTDNPSFASRSDAEADVEAGGGGKLPAKWVAETISPGFDDPDWAHQHSSRLDELKVVVDLHERQMSQLAAGGGPHPNGASAPIVGSEQREPGDLHDFLIKMPMFDKEKHGKDIDPQILSAFVNVIEGKVQRRLFYKDTMVIRKGAEADEMYFIYSGAADVFIDEPDDTIEEDKRMPPVAKISSGTCFGEAGLLDSQNAKRNAWIRASSDMEVYVLAAADFRAALAVTPQMLELFTEKSTKDTSQRDEHYRRYQDGGGNFKKGFRVKLKSSSSTAAMKEKVHHTLEDAYEVVPALFPKHAVEALLLTKIEEIHDL